MERTRTRTLKCKSLNFDLWSLQINWKRVYFTQGNNQVLKLYNFKHLIQSLAIIDSELIE